MNLGLIFISLKAVSNNFRMFEVNSCAELVDMPQLENLLGFAIIIPHTPAINSNTAISPPLLTLP